MKASNAKFPKSPSKCRSAGTPCAYAHQLLASVQDDLVKLNSSSMFLDNGPTWLQVPCSESSAIQPGDSTKNVFAVHNGAIHYRTSICNVCSNRLFFLLHSYYCICFITIFNTLNACVCQLSHRETTLTFCSFIMK